jgi:hypothetical protein
MSQRIARRGCARLCVGGSLDDGAAVGEEGKGVVAALETQEKIVALDVAVRGQALFHLGEIDGTGTLVDLDGVAAAEGDVGAAFAAEVGEVSVAADGAVWARDCCRDFGPLVGPEVAGEEGSAYLSRAPTIHLRASVTSIEAAKFTAVLRMPAVSQVSMAPEGGSGKMQARQAVSPGRMFMVTA